MRRVAATLLAGLSAASLIGARPAPDRGCDVADGRVFIPAGTVPLGEDGADRPGTRTAVPAFWIDRHEVTNRQFAAFVAATGHVTRAEQDGASAVFVPPDQPVALDNAARWWRFVKGADWRHPQGRESDLRDRADEPVVHVDREDAAAFARWAGGALPDTAQWERAAREDQDAPRTPSSWAFSASGKPRANVWEGVFPMRDTGEDDYAGIAPVGCFEANGFGIHDMVGNVWEWVSGTGPSGIIKGGSYLCAMTYCANFRPAAFQAQEQDLGASHIGFRVAYPKAAGRPTDR